MPNPEKRKGRGPNPRPIRVWIAVGRKAYFLVPASTSTHIGRPVRDDDIAAWLNGHHFIGDIIVIVIQRNLPSQDREPEFIPR